MSDWLYFLILLLILFLALAAAWWGYRRWTIRGWGKKVFPGKYYPVCVLDDGLERRMVFSKLVTQGAISLSSPTEIQLAYTRHMLAALIFQPDPHDIVMLGLGAGSLSRILHQYLPWAMIAVVEVEPQVVEVAGKYFHVRPDQNYRIFVEDGRRYLEQAPGPFDLIILDAFEDDRIPRHLTTVEFLALAKSRLRPQGVILANLFSANPFTYWRYLRTYAEVFPLLYRFPVPMKGNDVLVALPAGARLTQQELAAQAQKVQRQLQLPRKMVDLEAVVRHLHPRVKPLWPYAPVLWD